MAAARAEVDQAMREIDAHAADFAAPARTRSRSRLPSALH